MFFTVISTLLSLLMPSGFLYNCKWLISYVFIKINGLLTKKRFDYYDFEALNEPEKSGFLAPQLEFDFESPVNESHLLKGQDKILCYGVNSKSETVVVSVSRLRDDKAEACVYLKLENGKTYRLKETSGYQQPISDQKVFSCGGLQMHYECPMRRWRVFYSGYLCETSENNLETERMVYVKFAFLWRASSNVFDMMTDINPEQLASGFAGAGWKQPITPLRKLQGALKTFTLSGILRGEVYVDGSTEGHELYLFGHRIRSTGNTSFENMSIAHYLGQIHKNGAFVHFGKVSISHVAKDLYFGYVIQPDIDMKPITKIDLSIESSDATEKTCEVRASFRAHYLYELSGCEVRDGLTISGGNTDTTVNPFTFYLNGKKGSGICLKEYIKNGIHTKGIHIAETKEIKERLPVVPFSDITCQDSELTGGKGSSLGKLTSLSKDLKSFVVPNGVVVTTAAYENFLTKDITVAVTALEAVLYGRVKGNVKDACKRVCDTITREKIPEDLKEAIIKSLTKSFGQKMYSCKFAVRSSATGEDTEQMSAAGQMDTFLGISGIDEVLLAVKKCWASQFGFIATEYKRRYGQVLNSPMAVVIQEMVPCDVAGVMFTCDPLTGNPTLMTITANYGLGETVVSGSEEPDAIELGRDYYDHLTIRNKTIGAKSRKIVVKEGEGTTLEDVSENEKNECCLSEEMIMRLGKIGVQIEKHYRTRRDIEFGFWNNNLYIFQSRPVTSGCQEMDFEIENEFDGPMRIENDYFSFANAAEVLPGSISPFGYDVFFRMFNPIWQSGKKTEWQGDVSVRYFPVCWQTTKLHAMFNLADMFRGMHHENMNPLDKATMVALMGRLLEDPELFEVSEERYSSSTTKEWPWMKPKRLLECLFFSWMHLKKSQEIYPKYRVMVENCKTAEETFHVLTGHCSDLSQVMITHLICTQGSSLWNMFVLSSLAKAKGVVDDSVYRDFSNLVKTSSEVESADVPAAIQSMAFHISKSIKPEEFQKMQVEEALQWLRCSSSSAGQKFRYFLEKHGHRCVKEFDIACTTWGTDPKPLVKLLQNLAAHVSKDASPKQVESFEDLTSKLSIRLGFLTKLKLRFLVKMGWKGVQERENSKSLLVRGMHAWRQGYNHLAKMMVAEGRIPDERIMYFMTLEDVRELLKTRSPRILAKARHRQRLHPKMDKYMFPETVKGIPKPVSFEDEIVVNGSEESFTMKGIPVSQGVAKGFVRVAITLEEAADIKPGEILMAYGTDIGWTPYFPMLVGCVTELGGLVSHGAVVSREYGLPCVAGLHGATRRFKTGDYIFLDGNKGEVTKLPPPGPNTS